MYYTLRTSSWCSGYHAWLRISWPKFEPKARHSVPISPNCSFSLLDWLINEYLGKPQEVNYGNPNVTLSLCHRLVGFYPPEAQGKNGNEHRGHAQLISFPQLYLPCHQSPYSWKGTVGSQKGHMTTWQLIIYQKICLLWYLYSINKVM